MEIINGAAALRTDFLTVDQKHFSVRRPFLGGVVDVLYVPATKRFVVQTEFSKLNVAYDSMFIELFWDETDIDFPERKIYGRKILRSITAKEYVFLKENRTSLMEAYAFITRKRFWLIIRPAYFFVRWGNSKTYALRLTRRLFRGWKIEIDQSGSLSRGSLVFSHQP